MAIVAYPILVTKTLAFRELVLAVIRRDYPNVIIESYSQIVFQAIKGDIKAPGQISNFIEAIIVLAKVTMNIKFIYCNDLLID